MPDFLIINKSQSENLEQQRSIELKKCLYYKEREKKNRVVCNYFHLREKSFISNQGARAVVIQVSAQSEGELVYPIRFLPTINLQLLQLVYDSALYFYSVVK